MSDDKRPRCSHELHLREAMAKALELRYQVGTLTLERDRLLAERNAAIAVAVLIAETLMRPAAARDAVTRAMRLRIGSVEPPLAEAVRLVAESLPRG